jgi:release factor glutamine methyltransferase
MTRAAKPDSIASLLANAAQQLTGDSARLDAAVLLAHVLGKPRTYLLAWPDRQPDAAQQQRYAGLLARRLRGEPVAYLTGWREFWSLELEVTPDTLIPRPETETLVALALQAIPVDAALQIADLGTGSGAIALALASERPRCQVVATDRSVAALAVAKRNAGRLQLNNIEFLAGHWFAPLAGRRFDLVVSNPPYIATQDPHLNTGDVRFEPRGALTAGTHGMEALREIAQDARAHLLDNGRLFMEHGYDQGPAACALLQDMGYLEVRDHPDPAGLDRVVTGEKGSDTFFNSAEKHSC